MNRFKFKPSTLVVIAACTLSAGALALFYANRGDPGISQVLAAPALAAARPALTVTVTQPQSSVWPIKLVANGNIAAWQEASIGTESNGLRLVELRVNVGEQVQRGQLLARFADDSVQADLAQAQAGVAEATASAGEASANAERVRTLQGTGTFSGQQINQILTAEQTAHARVASAKAALAAQQLRLQQTQVLAPDSGIISARSASVGAVLGSGTELFRLIRQGRLEWRAQVPSAELGRIVPGRAVTVSVPSGAVIQGQVRTVAPTVDPQTRLGLVYVDLPPLRARAAPAAGGEGAPLPGMFGRGEFELGQSSALTLPQQAVVVRDGFSYAFRLNPDQRVSQVKLQTGRRMGEQVEVLGGLSADALLVASGAGFLNHGDLVKVAPASAPGAASKTRAPSVLPAHETIK